MVQPTDWETLGRVFRDNFKIGEMLGPLDAFLSTITWLEHMGYSIKKEEPQENSQIESPCKAL